MTTGQKITQLREETGITQEDLANKIDMSRQAIGKWERDEALPGTDALIKLSKVFDVNIDYFVTPKQQAPEVKIDDSAELQVSELKIDDSAELQAPEIKVDDSAELQVSEIKIDDLAEPQMAEVAATKVKSKHKSKSKIWLVCSLAALVIVFIVCIPIGLIAFTSNQSGMETLHTYDFVPISIPIILFIGLIAILVTLTIVIVILAVKRHKHR